MTACNEDGVWNGPSAVLSITVLPQFWQTGWFRAGGDLVSLGIVAGVVRYLSTQKLHRQWQTFKQQEALEKERARIARDLHDQLGANLTQVALLGEMAEADKNPPEEIEPHAQQISRPPARRHVRWTKSSGRSIPPTTRWKAWSITPANTRRNISRWPDLRYRADVPAQLPADAIPPEVRHNVFLAFKEAVNNVVKHAQASEALDPIAPGAGQFILKSRTTAAARRQIRSAQNPERPAQHAKADGGHSAANFPSLPARTAAQLCA